MIRWTPAGAVTFPRTLQVRTQRRYPGRVRAGAPLPSRDLSPEELCDNLRHFTAGMRTPRTTPCTALVLSGAGVLRRADLGEALALARAEGVEQVTVHADDDEDVAAIQALRGAVDRLTAPGRPETVTSAVRTLLAAQAAGLRTTASVPLDRADGDALAAVAAALCAVRPDQVVFTYPFPAPGVPVEDAPLPAAAVVALQAAVAVLDAAGVLTHIKGLPACYLGPLGARLGRTANRWYVDADHQQAAALLFFPGVVRFAKGDACRFCAADGRCDGFFSAHLGRPGVAPLQPISDG